jgi:phospholipase A-2-activating protein
MPPLPCCYTSLILNNSFHVILLLDDPWFAAQQFLEKNELSQLFLDQVAHFIINNTKSFTIGPQASQSSYTDPFTGASRYIPSASTSSETSDVVRGGADPFTGRL